jgi:hypothetical protein
MNLWRVLVVARWAVGLRAGRQSARAKGRASSAPLPSQRPATTTTMLVTPPFRFSATLEAHESDVKAVVAPYSDLVLTASRDETVCAWSRTAPAEREVRLALAPDRKPRSPSRWQAQGLTPRTTPASSG